VSVVVPTRDRWPLLSTSALPSALRQEDVAVEVVVVDDGSTDGTAAALAELPDARVRVLVNERPRGVSAARNAGIEAARGEWVAFLDDDDLWSPRKLRTQLDAAERAGASFAYAAVAVLDGGREVSDILQPPSAETLLSSLLARNTIPAGSSNVVVRAELLRRVGGFDEELAYVADWDLWLRLAAAATVAACPEVLVGYVRHPDGMLLTGGQAVRELRRFVEKHRSAGLEAEPARFLRWVASEHRAAGRRRKAAGVFLASAIAYRRPRDLVHAAASLGDRRGTGLRGRLRRLPAGPRPPHLGGPAWLDLYR
jgi:glycosyltransferase involved in cell wall biosynthesis